MLVTGGASGLGAAVVAAVADAGGTPFALDLSSQAHSPVASGQVDVTDRVAVQDAVEKAVARLGGLDAVVTAAGIDRCGKLLDIPAEEWEQVVKVNLFGTVNIVRATLPHLLVSHGRVVTVASTLALRGVSDATAYCASKFGVLGFTQALIAETAGQVGVTQLIPGGMDTHFFDGRTEQYRPTDNSQLNDPARVAQAVVFALTQPKGCEVRQLFIAHEDEPSWP